MNKKYVDENSMVKIKTNKESLFSRYKDIFQIKFKKIHKLQNIPKKTFLSKKFYKTFVDKGIHTPVVKLNESKSFHKNSFIIETKNSNNKNMNNMSYFKIRENNNSFYFNNNETKNNKTHFIHLNSTKNKENKIINFKINQETNNKNKKLYNSSSYSIFSYSIKNKLHNDNFNESNFNKKNEYFPNKSYIEKSQIKTDIKQKFFLNKSINMKLNRDNKNIIPNNKIFSLNSIPIKKLSPKIPKKEENFNRTLKKIHGIDLKIKELLERNNNGEESKNDELIKKQQYLRKMALFYDSLPSLLMNINKSHYIKKPCKILKTKDFGQNFYSTVDKKEKDEKEKLDKSIKNNPIIKYLFLQQILNSLLHKVKTFKENKDNKDNSINNSDSDTLKNLNEEILDFITYGYEFIPEDFFKNKNLESPKDLIINDEFIQVILKTKTSIENTLNGNSNNINPDNDIDIDINRIKPDIDIFSDTGMKITSRYTSKENNSGLMNKLILQSTKNKQKKGRFLYKKININNRNIISKSIRDKSTNYEDNKKEVYPFDNKNRFENKEKNHNNEDILFQLFEVLYEDIDNIDEKIKKHKIDMKNKNIIERKKNIWHKLLQKNDKNEIIYFIPKNKRRVNSGKKIKKRNKRNNNLYKKFDLSLSKNNKSIKSGKLFIELSLKTESKNDSVSIESKSDKITTSSYNIYYKNRFGNINQSPFKIMSTINLKKKSEFLKNIPELESNRKKENIFQEKTSHNKLFKNYSKVKINKNHNKKKKDKIKESTKKENNYNDIDNENDNNELKNNIDNENNISIHKKIHNKSLQNISNKDEIANSFNKNNKSQSIEKINKNEESDLYNKYLSDRHKHSQYKKDSKLLSNLIDTEKENIYKKKNKQKRSIFKMFLKRQSLEPKPKEVTKKVDYEKKEQVNNFFGNIEGKTLSEIERKKMAILFKFKNDIEYKISIGELNPDEIDNFNNFNEKINNLKDNEDEFDMEIYVNQMEKYFESFKEEIANNEKKKLEEDRINKYLRKFKEEYNIRNFYKELQEKRLCKVINFSKINQINVLNETKEYEY